MNTTIYIVIGIFPYEGYGVVKAFRSKKDAQTYAKKCDDHETTEPKIDWYNASDDELDEYRKQKRQWEKNHPAEQNSGAERYDVMEIQLVE